MKKIRLVLYILPVIFILVKCNATKTTVQDKKPTEKLLSYKIDIEPIMVKSCTPCHFPPEGRKEPLNTYLSVKENIDDIISSVKLPQSNPKFMPFRNKKPALNDSLVAVLERWKKQDMPN